MRLITLYSYTDMNYDPKIKPYISRYFKYKHKFKYYSYIKENNLTGLGFRRKKLKSIIERSERMYIGILIDICNHYDALYMEEIQIAVKQKQIQTLVLISRNGDDYD